MSLNLGVMHPDFIQAIEDARGTMPKARFLNSLIAKAIGYTGPIYPGNSNSALRDEVARLRAALAEARK